MRITSIFGLPAHVFFVHIPIILVPLVAVGTVLMLWPSMRRRLGWVVAVLAAGALGSTYLATQSGKALRRYVEPTHLVREHIRLGEKLTIWAFLLFVLVVAIALWDEICRRRLRSVSDGPGAEATFVVGGSTITSTAARRVALTLGALSVVVAGVSTYWVYRIGHTGATARWSTVQHRIDTGKEVNDQGGGR